MPSHKGKRRLAKARRIVEHHGCLLLDDKVGDLKQDPVRIMCICTKVIRQVPYLFSQRPYCKECRRVPGDEVRKFGKRCRRLLRAVRKGGEGAAEVLGYGRDKLEELFAAVPDRPRLGCKAWNFDHVRPLTVLARLGLRDPRIANALDNILPMKVEENSVKGARCDPREVSAWLRSKGFVREVADG